MFNPFQTDKDGPLKAYRTILNNLDDDKFIRPFQVRDAVRNEELRERGKLKKKERKKEKKKIWSRSSKKMDVFDEERMWPGNPFSFLFWLFVCLWSAAHVACHP